MKNPARSRGLRKATRDILQVVISLVAAGGATAIIDLIVGSVDPVIGIILAFVFKILVTYAQNSLEARGSIPTLLPTPGLVTETTSGVVTTAVGTVDAVAESSTQVVGEVLNTAGKVVGGLTGAVSGLRK